MSVRRNTTRSERTNGKVKICQICDKPAVIRGLYCSPEHAEEYKVRASEQYARLKTFERDKGICGYCGTNATLLEYARSKANGSWQRFKQIRGTKLKWRSDDECKALKQRYLKIWMSMIVRLRIPNHLWRSGAMWHSDHELPVYRGGGETGLENRVTACFTCHLEKTSAEAHGRKILGKHKMHDVLKGVAHNLHTSVK